MGMSDIGDHDGPISAINVTPLVDVMLVLLVIFMVTAPMMQQGLEIDLPKAASGPVSSPSEEPLTLSLTKDGEISVGEGTVLALNEVGLKIRAILKERGDTSQKVFIKADTALDYGSVMAVIGELYKSDVKEVGLISQPEQ